MKDSLLKDALVDYLLEDYTKEECIEQLDNAEIELITIVKITYDNGVKESVTKDADGKFIRYE